MNVVHRLNDTAASSWRMHGRQGLENALDNGIQPAPCAHSSQCLDGSRFRNRVSWHLAMSRAFGLRHLARLADVARRIRVGGLVCACFCGHSGSDARRVASFRYLALVLVALGYLASAWLVGEQADMPQVILIAAWLLVARLLPPAGLRFGTKARRHWIFVGAGLSFLVWGAGLVLMVVLMMVFSEPAVRDANGELHSTSAAWIFPLAWLPYFIAEAILRGWHTPDPQTGAEELFV